jgi:hypothetical protein
VLNKQSREELLLIADHTRIDTVPLYRNGVAHGSLCVGIDEPIKKKKSSKRYRHTEATGPRIPFKQFPGMWFVHSGEICSVQTSPVATIRDAVTNMIHDDMCDLSQFLSFRLNHNVSSG